MRQPSPEYLDQLFPSAGKWKAICELYNLYSEWRLEKDLILIEMARMFVRVNERQRHLKATRQPGEPDSFFKENGESYIRFRLNQEAERIGYLSFHEWIEKNHMIHTLKELEAKYGDKEWINEGFNFGRLHFRQYEYLKASK